MKQTAPDVTVQSNLTTVQHHMGIDEEGMGTVLSILSNMYSDPHLALVREYASNALDSHREAGNTGPILVSSPTHFEPKLIIEDFGVGLSADEVLNVYARYGTSTKRNSETQIGHFGIGAKSAFTVAPQFIVTAVREGERTVALFALNGAAAPTVNIVQHTYGSDEPNGVRVEIGVRDVDAVNTAIAHLFPTWPQGTVMVDGIEPVSIWSNLHKLADDVHLGLEAEPHNTGRWTIVMGGIPYAVTPAVAQSLPFRETQVLQSVMVSHAQVYLTVPIGAVDITPSREELRVTDKTTETVRAMIGKFHTLLGGWVTEQISGAKSQAEAVIAYYRLRAKLGSANVGSAATWHGKHIPTTSAETPFPWFKLARRGYGSPYTARRETNYRVVPAASLYGVLFVTGVPERRVRSVQLAAKAFLTAQDKGSQDKYDQVVAVPEGCGTFSKDWFAVNDPGLRTMTFDDFMQYKPAPAPRGTGTRSAVRYELHNGTIMDPAELRQIIAKGGVVFYMTAYERPRHNHRNALADMVIGGNVLVLLSGRQEADPFLRRVPGATHYPPALRKVAQTVLDGITQNDRDIMGAAAFRTTLNFEIMRWLAKHADKITHPGVTMLLSEHQRAETLRTQCADRTEQITQSLIALDKNRDTLGQSSFDHKLYERVMSDLPLLGIYFLRSWMQSAKGNEHMVAYINLAATL